MEKSRIPAFRDKSSSGMLKWFTEMLAGGMLFHPDDDPADISLIADGKDLFTTDECAEVRAILDEMFDKFGDEVYDAAHPVYMHAMGIQVEPLWPMS